MVKRSQKERGSVLATTMVIALLAIIMAVKLAEYSTFQIRTAARYQAYKNEFAIAEAVLANAFASIRFLVQNSGPPSPADLATITPPTFHDYDVKGFTIEKLSDQNETISQGPWKGLNLRKIQYRVTTRVHQKGNTSNRFHHPGVELSQDLELRYVPLHTFAICYDCDLEIHPGPPMIIDGRVHTNGNLYVGAGSSLAVRDSVTAVGKILHGSHPDSGMGTGGGDVTLWNGVNDVSMQPGEDGWLDHLDSNWASESQNRWNGYVNDESQNVSELPLPIPEGEDAHSIIERADPDNDPPSLHNQKFEYKAGLKILRDPATGIISGFLQDGTPVSLTYQDPEEPSEQKSVYEEGSFYDTREERWVSTIDINIARLMESGIAPDNGILYVSNEGPDGAVRITHAAELPSNLQNGFSIATDDALYIKGDFNTVNREKALVAGDAVTILSNAWDDNKSTSVDMNVRKAAETTVNAVFFQGIVPSQIDPEDGVTRRYSGGVENYFRLLENWSGVTLRFSGSLICLWKSRKWTGWWRGWPVYRAPDRVWSWDSGLTATDGPPGSPNVYEILRSHWNVHSLSESGSS